MSGIYIEIAAKAAGTVIGGAALYLLQRGVRAAIDMRDNVRDMMRNHLPHITEELKGIKERLDGLELHSRVL